MTRRLRSSRVEEDINLAYFHGALRGAEIAMRKGDCRGAFSHMTHLVGAACEIRHDWDNRYDTYPPAIERLEDKLESRARRLGQKFGATCLRRGK